MKKNTKLIGVTLDNNLYDILSKHKEETGVGISTTVRSILLKWAKGLVEKKNEENK